MAVVLLGGHAQPLEWQSGGRRDEGPLLALEDPSTGYEAVTVAVCDDRGCAGVCQTQLSVGCALVRQRSLCGVGCAGVCQTPLALCVVCFCVLPLVGGCVGCCNQPSDSFVGGLEDSDPPGDAASSAGAAVPRAGACAEALDMV